MTQHFENLTPEELGEAVTRHFDDMTSLLIAKRRSYGPHNLTRFGPIGIIIRASDKIDRLTTMCQNDTVASADGDTMDDAWRDLIGYAVLGLLLTQMQREAATHD